MSKIIKLKERKKAVDAIKRTSSAVCASACVKLAKFQKKMAHHKNLDKNFLIAENLLNIYIKNQCFSDFKKCGILITADKGMCSNFALNTLRQFNEKKNQYDFWILIGQKAERLESENVIFFSSCEINQHHCLELSRKILNFFQINQIQFCDILFNQKTFNILNCKMTEPSEENLNLECVNFALCSLIFNKILLSLIEENKQRMLSMTNAKNNATQMSSDIDILYNKARQEKITNEINEIIGGLI